MSFVARLTGAGSVFVIPDPSLSSFFSLGFPTLSFHSVPHPNLFSFLPINLFSTLLIIFSSSPGIRTHFGYLSAQQRQHFLNLVQRHAHKSFVSADQAT